MTIQSFRRVKIDVNDTLYSKIIRFGHTRCLRCLKVKDLQCAHIIGRGNYSTRFLLGPVRNAVPLCSDCHDWFDRCKNNTPIFNENARPFFLAIENAYAFLVERCGYSWRDLQRLYLLGQTSPKEKYVYWKKDITLQLRIILRDLENPKERS